jgi:hypothetical protein
MGKQKSIVRGVLAGIAGGLAAAWVMNQFMQQAPRAEPKAEKRGPIVPYAFGALTGGLYGGLAEYSPKVTSGFGTTFGGALFSNADLLAVPALDLVPAEATPFAAHIVYGATTELVRRVLRSLL